MKVIALSGWKMSGKDLCAEYLSSKYGFIRKSFADALKEMVASEYNIPLEYLHSQKMKEEPLLQYPVESTDEFTAVIHQLLLPEFRTKTGEKAYALTRGSPDGTGGITASGDEQKLYWTPRALAIFKGSGNRAVTSKYWTQRIIDCIKQNDGNYVISDLRFRSEAQQLRDAFGSNLATVRICRFETNPSTDASETDLDKYNFDYYINNYLKYNTGKETIYHQLSLILEELGHGKTTRNL